MAKVKVKVLATSKARAQDAGREIVCKLVRLEAAAYMMKAATSTNEFAAGQHKELDCYGCLDLIKDEVGCLHSGLGSSLHGHYDELLEELDKTAKLLDLMLDHAGFKTSPAIPSIAILCHTAIKELSEYADYLFPILEAERKSGVAA